ncbi:hypothetical protein A8P42_02800 [Treponema pallidum subsp. pallidum]|nr:hypothetical protein SD24_02795 [Treponema pallidum subsp. pallidum]ANI44435.1 hypothetical protein SD25_02785 [Treponema pallidum subsp. pallidum]ANI45400.1 hypothetical protein SD22_02775 [Treponema pallidum subsp. pallidum]ANI46370.1 hypothetical protein SD23_02780 [Treponema pallidum subsp. pallidum]ANI47336.1 hypothetical protein SD16_02785 [Treponema pallidum subsp. pallidum]
MDAVFVHHVYPTAVRVPYRACICSVYTGYNWFEGVIAHPLRIVLRHYFLLYVLDVHKLLIQLFVTCLWHTQQIHLRYCVQNNIQTGAHFLLIRAFPACSFRHTQRAIRIIKILIVIHTKCHNYRCIWFLLGVRIQEREKFSWPVVIIGPHKTRRTNRHFLNLHVRRRP